MSKPNRLKKRSHFQKKADKASDFILSGRILRLKTKRLKKKWSDIIWYKMAVFSDLPDVDVLN